MDVWRVCLGLGAPSLERFQSADLFRVRPGLGKGGTSKQAASHSLSSWTLSVLGLDKFSGKRKVQTFFAQEVSHNMLST